MNNFCVETLALPRTLRPRFGVISSPAFAVTDEAGQAAAHILAEARRQAEALMKKARQEADHLMRDEQRRVAEEATQLMQVLQQMQHEVLEQAQELAIELAQLTFDRLVLETTARERLEAACRRVRAEAPSKLTEAVAWVHPLDRAELDSADSMAWAIKEDDRLPRGTCRLEAASGEWRAQFDLAAAALRAALAQFGAPGAAAPGSDDIPEQEHAPADDHQHASPAHDLDHEAEHQGEE
ncbi:FliH/SctL family protein [Herbaspirillum sp. alder98]|uniref:FliH/SctL family protein n=1 Tax=Herbaspirillum sp. alder98 TaxID=2913096 RepID=UPI001CD82C4A|nr:FliH/SctL family protein [Herbaspirillum sp. alder98]MCA1325651.1 flagellar biosynthesis/type III secretory pathway protein [Herbaspirillum sp. alder98]